MKLDSLDMIKLIPAFMRNDEAVAALCSAMNALIGEPGARVPQQRIWDMIDTLDDASLDELAWELNIDWYKTSMTLDAKRETVKNARRIMARRGTKWAVENLVTSYLGSGIVVEWFEVGGDPFTFYISTTEDVTSQSVMDEFLQAANAAKSARSRLLGVYSYIEHTVTVLAQSKAGAGVFIYRLTGTAPHIANVGDIDVQAAESGPRATVGAIAYPLCGTRSACAQ